MKGLPLSYNRDMQEDKEPVFDTADTVTQTLAVVTGMLSGIAVHRDTMRHASEDGFITATDLADYLVRKGLPFRQAHEVVGRAVLRALSLKCGLKDLSLAEYKKLSSLIKNDVYQALSVARVGGAPDIARRYRAGEPQEAACSAQEARKMRTSHWSAGDSWGTCSRRCCDGRLWKEDRSPHARQPAPRSGERHQDRRPGCRSVSFLADPVKNVEGKTLGSADIKGFRIYRAEQSREPRSGRSTGR